VRCIPFIAVKLDQRAEPLFPGRSPSLAYSDGRR
jgi:hypothetical protein